MKKLAVVIPAFKITYFKQALNSLANQTDNRFTVYIGDDNSPDDLKAIVNEFSNILSIKYVKFTNNIGAKNLVNQWTRCVELSEEEEWIWLFSDDDIADNTCVEMFYHTIEISKKKYDVYRFNTVVIDYSGNQTSLCPVGPELESSVQMTYHLLLGKRGNSMPDHIFSRKVFEQTGGFVFTRYAQGADWATSIKFSKDKGICIMPDAKLNWRYSGLNISSLAGSNKIAMLNGHIDFLVWIAEHFKYLILDTKSKFTYKDIQNASIQNLKSVIKFHYKGFDKKMFFPIFNLLRINFKLPVYKCYMYIYQMYRN